MIMASPRATTTSHGVVGSTMPTTTATSSTSTTQSYSVLTDKVNRALAVRTDTPAMKAALDALSHIQIQQHQQVSTKKLSDQNSSKDYQQKKDGGTNGMGTQQQPNVVVIDSKNVRSLIEMDALHQALELQESLRSIVTTVQQLREQITNVTKITKEVRNAAYQNVMVPNTTTSATMTPPFNMLPGSALMSTTVSVLDGNLTIPTTTSISTAESEEEYQLASTIMNAFVHRNQTQQRYDAIHEFMSQYNLNEYDTYLIEQYNFEDRSLATGATRLPYHSSATWNEENDNVDTGMAFLRALRRVRQIRKRLQKRSAIWSSSSNDDIHLTTALSGQQGDDIISTTTTTNNNSASSTLRMMEQLAEKQERAYERLYHWIHQYLQLFPMKTTTTTTTTSSSDDSNPTAAPFVVVIPLDELLLEDEYIQLALYTLKDLPAFYCHTIELIASSRRSEVTKRFLIALTSGTSGNSGTNNNNSGFNELPIEMKSHDTMAYVGDMLAFAFKSFSVEADIAKGLLEYKPPPSAFLENDDDEDDVTQNEKELDNNSQRKNRRGSSSNLENEETDDDYNDDDDEDFTMNVEKVMGSREMLSISMSGLSRPLKSRILQVISTLARRPGIKSVDGRLSTGNDTNVHDDDGDDDDTDDDIHGGDDFGEECHRLRTKIVHLYDICGLLLFYVGAMDKTIDKLPAVSSASSSSSTPTLTIMRSSSSNNNINNNNPLVSCLQECYVEGAKAYEATVRVYCALLDQWSLMTGESEAALAYSLLLRLADVRKNSPGYSTEDIVESAKTTTTNAEQHVPADDDTADMSYRKVLSMEWVTETLVTTCLTNSSTTTLSTSSSGKESSISLDDISQLKQLVTVSEQVGGTKKELVKELRNAIELKEHTIMDEFVQLESIHILELCGLDKIADAYWNYQNEYPNTSSSSSSSTSSVPTTTAKKQSVPMSTYPGLSLNDLERALPIFYSTFVAPPIPTYENNIQDPYVRKQIRYRITDSICTLYENVYVSYSSESNDSTSFQRIFQHDPQQVRTLFSV